MSIPYKTGLVVKTVAGKRVTVPRFYPKGPFSLHRSVGRRGWTVTHTASRHSLVQCLPSLRDALMAAEEFERLTPKWAQCTSPFGLYRDMKAVMNVRELHAINYLIKQLETMTAAKYRGATPP